MASGFGMELGDQDNSYSLVRALKTKLRTLVKKGNRCEVHLTSYPESPADLPRPIFEHAYPSEPPLDQLAIPVTSGASVTSIPMRASNAKLRRNSTDSKGSRAPPQDAWPSSPQEMMGMWVQGMLQVMREKSVQGQNAGGEPNLANLQINRNKRKELPGPGPSTALAITAGAGAAGEQGQEQEQGDAEKTQKGADTPASTDHHPKKTKSGLSLPTVQENPVLDALVTRDAERVEQKAEATQKGKNQTQGKPKSKAKAQVKAKAKAKQKPVVQAKPKAKSKGGKVFLKKPASAIAAGNGWLVETRVRGTGQTDKHYISPDGKVYRTLGDARNNGFTG